MFTRIRGIFDLHSVALSSIFSVIPISTKKVCFWRVATFFVDLQLAGVEAGPYLVVDFNALVVPFVFLYAGLDVIASPD